MFVSSYEFGALGVDAPHVTNETEFSRLILFHKENLRIPFRLYVARSNNPSFQEALYFCVHVRLQLLGDRTGRNPFGDVVSL
jgi:hypothetical protein